MIKVEDQSECNKLQDVQHKSFLRSTIFPNAARVGVIVIALIILSPVVGTLVESLVYIDAKLGGSHLTDNSQDIGIRLNTIFK